MNKLLPNLKSNIFNRFQAKFSFSQAGEDCVLQRIFLGQEFGFYVDVGAYHPFKLSNTFWFYLNSWKGINIEPRPDSKKIFDKYRPRDINLEIGIAEKAGYFTYHSFKENTLNQFSFTQSNVISENKSSITKVYTRPLANILEEYLPKNQTIDFLTIDTEGAEHQVLISNNWLDFAPKVILIEQNINNRSFSKVNSILQGEKYKEAYRIPVNKEADSVFYLKN